MALQNSPVDRASDALRFASSLGVALQLIQSNSTLPPGNDLDNLVYDLLDILLLVTTDGKEAMRPIEDLDLAMKLNVNRQN